MKKSVCWTKAAWESYIYWQEHDKRIVKRINQLILDIHRHPFEGVGKPEPLKYDFKGMWSRRINEEHRLVYKFENDQLVIFQCRYHY